MYSRLLHCALFFLFGPKSIILWTTCLTRHRPHNSFSPQIVWDLEDDQIVDLGSEDEDTVRNRLELQEKLRVLEDGLKELDAFTARPNSALRSST